MTLLRATAIDKAFGGNPVLRGVDFAVASGEIVGVLGENGAGKSTLMNILSGALRPDGGTIALDEVPVRFGSVRDGLAADIRFVHQELSVVGALSVAENIALGDFPVKASGLVDFPAMRAAARRQLDAIGATGIDPRAPAGRLRLGEQQIVEIAKAVARKPRLLIMDEPTASLTAHEVAAFLAFVRRIAAEGTAVIFITHRLDEALALCHRLVVLRNGRVVAERLPAETDRTGVIADMTGRAALFDYQPPEHEAPQPLLRLENVGDGRHIAGIDLEIGEGEVFGLFGLVGAGRTELIETLFGVRRLKSGRVLLGGTPVAIREPSQAVALGLSLVPEGRKTAGILPRHSIRRNLTLSSLAAVARGPFVSPSREAAAMARYRQDLGIRMDRDRLPITTLSGGNQQKVLIGRALMTEPRLLLLDEPTHGVDVGAKADIYAIIRAQARAGRTVLVASSETEEIMTLCDRAAVLSKGRVAGVLSRAAMSEAAMLDLAFQRHSSAA